MKKYPTLYSRTSTGAVQTWYMEQDGNKYRSVSGQLDGQKTESGWQFAAIKNDGKANSTTPEQQATKEVEAKYKKKKKTGYTDDVNEIDNIGYIEPMLAKQFTDYQDSIVYPVAVENKLNGICCIRQAKGGFSRKGEQFFCIDHILRVTEALFDVFPDAVLHGELFNYELKNRLNKIASLVSVNRKPESITPADLAESEKTIKFYVYDGYGFNGITEKTPFAKRKEALKEILKGVKYVEVLDYRIANSLKEVEAELKATRQRQEEGIMVKLLNGIYEHKRSKNILKHKNFFDVEFEVVGFEEGTGNWAGCAKGVVCKLHKPTPDGKTTFTSNIRGTQEELRELWENGKKHTGKMATVEYQELSEYGVPLIPYTQLPFRDYE